MYGGAEEGIEAGGDAAMEGGGEDVVDIAATVDVYQQLEDFFR